MRALLDTNILVDVLQAREPWCHDGETIFLAAANRRISAAITAKQAGDLYYFVRKQFSGQDNAEEKARDILARLLSLFEIIDTLAEDCRNAIGIRNRDYEDAILIESARRTGADCIITRNLSHFEISSVPVYNPAEFVKRLTSEAAPE